MSVTTFPVALRFGQPNWQASLPSQLCREPRVSPILLPAWILHWTVFSSGPVHSVLLRGKVQMYLHSFHLSDTPEQISVLFEQIACDYFLTLDRICHLNKTKILRGLETYQGVGVRMSCYNMKRGRGDSGVRLNKSSHRLMCLDFPFTINCIGISTSLQSFGKSHDPLLVSGE